MKLSVFAIFDSKAEAYASPFFMGAIGQAIRAFSDEASNDSSNIAKHPEDYTLFHLGTYDDATASFDLLPTPRSLGVAVEFVGGRGQAA